MCPAGLVVLGAPSDQEEDFFVDDFPLGLFAGIQRAGYVFPSAGIADGTSARLGHKFFAGAAGN